MKIVIAPDSYKEGSFASEVVQAIEEGSREIFPDAQYASVPVAGGGEGTVEAMIAVTQGTERHVWVTGSPGEKVNASWGVSGDDKTAFTEMAVASGLELVPAERRDPLVTASRGTGESVLQALGNGVTDAIIGIGDSATNDGGAGMVQVLGAKSCDANGNEIGFDGDSLSILNDIDISGLDPRLKDCIIRVACGVTNPLAGDSDTSRIFGLQKGASEAVIVELNNNPPHYADVIKRVLYVDVKDAPGAGATDGISAVLMASLGTELRSGIEIVTTVLSLEEHIYDYTLVITGEGRIDSRSIHDKVPAGVANMTKKYHKPVIGIAGSPTNDIDVIRQYGIDAIFNVLTNIGMLDEVPRRVYDNICRASRNIAVILTTGMRNAG